MMVEADLLCDRIGIIDRGKIVAIDTPENLKRLISGADTTVMEMNIPNLSNRLMDGIRSLECVSTAKFKDNTHIKIQARGDEAFDEIIDMVRRNEGKIAFIKNIEPTLEDVFLHLTGHEVRDETSDKVKGIGQHGHWRSKKRVR
jgi:ABC-2 type transport system ATP-binding protein